MIKEFKVIRDLTPLLKIHPWVVPATIFLGILSSLAEGIGISLFIPFLHSIGQTNFEPDTGNWLVDSLARLFNNIPPDRRLFVISCAIFGSILLKTILAYSHTILFAWFYTRVGHRLRCSLFEQLLTVGYRFLEKSRMGKLMNILTTESDRTTEALSTFVGQAINLATLAVYVTLLLLISWELTLVVSAALLLISLLVRLITRRVKPLGKAVTEHNADMAGRMVEGLESMQITRAFGREPYEQKRFESTSARLSALFMKLRTIEAAINPIYEILAGVLLVAILLSTLHHPTNLPALLVFVFVLYRLQPKVRALDQARVYLNALASGVAEVTNLLDRTDKPYVVSGQMPHRRLKRGIYFDRVTFQYDALEDPALKDISLHIPANRTTAFVGPSGAGKTTLIKLILRFYDPTEGAIYLDDRPLPDLDLQAWRSRIAIVSQDLYMFNTTVRENIAYGKLDATDDEIVAAAKLANAHDFISQLPKGYDTVVGNRGIRLSGGQQQRITLARAIVRDPEVLILDEATNALDSISEHLIQEALHTLSHNRTVIVIAHRLSTIEQADHIVVLEQGRVCEEGTLQQLLEADGLFARLYHLQHRQALN